jgi:hypothetical protein
MFIPDRMAIMFLEPQFGHWSCFVASAIKHRLKQKAGDTDLPEVKIHRGLNMAAAERVQPKTVSSA